MRGPRAWLPRLPCNTGVPPAVDWRGRVITRYRRRAKARIVRPGLLERRDKSGLTAR